MKNLSKKNNRQILISLVGLILTPILPVYASPVVIDRTIAQNQPTTTPVVEGKTTAISFKTDEVITFVVLSDQSKNVYTTNAPVESGQAKSVYIRQIENLEIPGATASSNPNLFVVTTDRSGEQSEYEFTLFNEPANIDSYKIVIAPPKPVPPKPKIIPPPDNTVQTTLGEASPEDVELGLETTLKTGRLTLDDPVVLATREYIALTQNGSSSDQAIEAVQLPISFVQQLGSLGLQEDTRRRLLPLNSEPFSQKK
ncbi:MAG: hypothetical protein ACRC1Z_10335 [Waterburya sp.]